MRKLPLYAMTALAAMTMTGTMAMTSQAAMVNSVLVGGRLVIPVLILMCGV